jgi:ABC-type multidrug transport system fused ATPase/permease subunit
LIKGEALFLIKKSWGLLSRRQQVKLIVASAIQALIGLLDLAGIVILGLLGSISLQSNTDLANSNSKLKPLFDVLVQVSNKQSDQLLILALSAGVLLIVRTILSIFYTKRTLKFFSTKSAEITTALVSKLLRSPYLYLTRKTGQNNIYSATRGIEILMMQVLANVTVLISDVNLMLLLGLSLFYIDFFSATATALMFLIIAIVLGKIMNQSALSLGIENSNINMESNQKLMEALISYREVYVVNRQDFIADEIGKLRYRLASVVAQLNFMPYLSKYVIESSIVIIALALGAIQATRSGAVSGIATLTLFMAASTRIVPAALRAQQSYVRIQEGLGAGANALALIQELEEFDIGSSEKKDIDFTHSGFLPHVNFSNISFAYPGHDNSALNQISFTIEEFQTIAIVGKSGAGKSTLIDLLLGVLQPDSGSVTISDLPPRLIVSKWPGAIGFVPQEVHLHHGSIRENLILGFNKDEIPEGVIQESAKKAGILNFIEGLPDGFDTQIGERGTRLSGGQRQRLGIARALMTKPTLLILDEATSALDAESESQISMVLDSLKDECTVIIIAHRLSSIRKCDQIIYMDSGSVKFIGNFETVRANVPDFDKQAKLMGL